MKSFLLICYTLLYFVVSTGIIFSVHKCGGEVVNVNFFSVKSETCGSANCEKKGCCENETHLIKVKDDQTLFSDVSIPLLTFDLILSKPFLFELPEVFEVLFVPKKLPIRPPPQLSSKTPLFIKKRVLII